MIHSRPSLSASLLLVVALAGLTACGGSKSSSTSGSSGGAIFSQVDLAGDWCGTLTPNNASRPDYPFYFRYDGQGNPYEGADALGREWLAATAVMSASVTQQGKISLTVMLNGETFELSGHFNKAATRQQGKYSLTKNGVVVGAGTYESTKSPGAGAFTIVDHLSASWSGIGYNEKGKSRDFLIELSDDGSVVSGEMVGEHTFTVGAGNVGIFQFSKPEVGRLDNVVIQCDDGATITLDFALVNEDGTYLGGPGADSELGPGTLRIYRQ